MIPKPLHRSIKELMSQFRSSLSNNGCNDWDFSPDELQSAREYLGNPEATNEDYTVWHIINKALGL